MLRAASWMVAALIGLTCVGARADVLSFEAIEKRTGGRLGMTALTADSNRTLVYRADERFMMLSAFKFLLVAHVLHRVDAGQETLTRKVAYGPADLLEYAPITAKHVDDKGMSVDALCAAALQYSDNTAANVLLGTLGGPAGLTHYIRTLGDNVTHLDRTEPTLNDPVAGKDLDSTTPAAFARLVGALLVGDKALRDTSRAQLSTWTLGNTTGDHRLRAGVPVGWRVADKTGTGPAGALNDVGVLYPPHGAPVVVATFLTGCTLPRDACEAALADVARRVAAWNQD